MCGNEMLIETQLELLSKQAPDVQMAAVRAVTSQQIQITKAVLRWPPSCTSPQGLGHAGPDEILGTAFLSCYSSTGFAVSQTVFTTVTGSCFYIRLYYSLLRRR
jgi:hypothetical protein